MILVIGSLNADLVIRTPRLPIAGETLTGESLQIFTGGKGANQACAAALLGAQTKMAGLLGSDPFTSKILNDVLATGVDTSLISKLDRHATGTATILVLPDGNNCIILSPGANGAMTREFAVQAAQSLEPGDLLLCQLEVPLATIEAAIEMAHTRQARVMLDPAPAIALPSSLLPQVDILTPNQTEAAILLQTDHQPETLDDGLLVARELQRSGPKIVIVKMGELGCAVVDRDKSFVVPAQKVQAVDSTAAGDVFNGALAVALSEHRPLKDAVEFASVCASISVKRRGAIASMPSRVEVDQALAK